MPPANAPPPPHFYAPPNAPLSLLHVDETLIFVNKPAGLLSVPGKHEDHQDCLENRLRAAYPDTLLIHRLDMDTSGVMVFARTKTAQRHLGLQFERRHVEKTYIADVEGQPEADSGQIDLPLITDWPNRPLQKICHETGRKAITGWSVLNRSNDHARLELTPLTGRSHQLRVHMLALGHPILGDPFYGDAKSAKRMHLHAEKLSLFHPDGGARIDIAAKVPF